MSEPYDAYFVFDKKSKLDKALKFIKTNSKLIYPAHGIYSFIFKKTVGLAKELKSLYGSDAESFGKGCAPDYICAGSFILGEVEINKSDIVQKKHYEAYGVKGNKFILKIHFIDRLFCLMITDNVSYKAIPDFFKNFCNNYSVERAFLTYDDKPAGEFYSKA